MNGFHLRPFLLAALFLSPSAAQAQAEHKLSTTVRISLTILPTARIGTRSGARGQQELVVTDAGGRPLSAPLVYVFRDSRGERELLSFDGLQEALVASNRAGDNEVDVTLVF